MMHHEMYCCILDHFEGFQCASRETSKKSMALVKVGDGILRMIFLML